MIFDKLPNPHVISLAWKAERRRRFFNCSANRGYAGIEWFQAIDGRSMPDLPSWALGNPGVYGCLHSHVELYRRALDNNWPALTVFEDDALIGGSEPELVAALNQRTPAADIFKFYPPVTGCLGTWSYVIFPGLMREIVNRIDQDRFPEGYLAHIDQLIHFLCSQDRIMAYAPEHLVSHTPRDASESAVGWTHCYRPAPPGVNLASVSAEPSGSRARPRILVGICSCAGNGPRREAVRDTWLTKLPDGVVGRFFVGDAGEAAPEADTVKLSGVPDGYQQLPGKVLSFFRHALEHHDFEWLFKCDDDTYVAPERLASLIREGTALVGNDFLTEKGYASGGAGYLVSREWVKRLVEDDSIPSEGSEDVIVTGAIITGGGTAVSDPRLNWNTKSYPRPHNDTITSHWCQPEMMRAIHTILHAEHATVEVVHPQWADRLFFYANGYFARASSRCSGTWSREGDTPIRLRWFDWEEESLHPMDDGEDSETSPSDSFRSRYYCNKHLTEEVIVDLAGGLGNQMFQYAHGLAVARRLGAELKLLCRDPVRGFQLGCFGLELASDPGEPDFVFVEQGGYREGAEWACVESIIRAKARSVIISGYFQNFRYFSSVANEIRSIFLPGGRPGAECAGPTRVGVHVRRGDFLGNSRHDLCRVPYFTTAIKLVRALVEEPRFIVISDDPRWCEEALGGEADLVVAGPADAYEDLMKLCSCSAFILSNSTFGWWGAWLARGSPVIAPNRFLADMQWRICPDEWITLPPCGL